MDLSSGTWLNEPEIWQVKPDQLLLTTQPHTDFWQRSYYGFRNDNAPAFLFAEPDNFTFTCKASFDYKNLFDQSGVIIYLDSNNWFKASIEYENQQFSRLGSVVTNLGFSDWATRDIDTPQNIWYRLSRRGADFLIESSFDGMHFEQMRVFHLHLLGDTSIEMGKANPPQPAKQQIKFGLYACSPSESSFEARFSELELTQCNWLAHAPN